MRKLSVLFAIALLVLLFMSCSSGSNSSKGENNGSKGENKDLLAENNQIFSYSTKEPYIGSGTLYMSGTSGAKIGMVNNGKITFDLPQTADSRFIEAITPAPEGINLEPSDAEAWAYSVPFRFVDGGKHIGNLLYVKRTENAVNQTSDMVTYLYSSKDMKMYGVRDSAGYIAEYDIDAKKGWNEIYLRQAKETGNEAMSVRITTDLSKVPAGLAWMIWELQ